MGLFASANHGCIGIQQIRLAGDLRGRQKVFIPASRLLFYLNTIHTSNRLSLPDCPNRLPGQSTPGSSWQVPAAGRDSSFATRNRGVTLVTDAYMRRR